ncbi:TniQ [compost metagenome]
MKIFFLAHGRHEESPRSVLIRTAVANGFGSVSAMARAFGSKDSRQPIAWQMRHSKLITELSRNSDLNGGQFQGSFYTQNGPTSESPVEIMGLKVPAAAIRADAYNFCPECLRDGGHRSIQDLIWLETCPYHGCQYGAACPNCQRTIHWTQLVGNLCRCGYDLCNGPTVASQSKASRLVLNFFRTRDQAALDRFIFALRALRYETQSDRSSVLEMAARVANCEEQALDELLVIASERYPCLPVRALIAPWMISSDEWISGQVARLLQANAPMSKAVGACHCSELKLYQDEMLKALQASSKKLRSLLLRNLVQRGKQGKVRWLYSAINLCKLLETHTSIPLAADNAPEVPPTEADNDMVTIEEAAVRLGVYPDAVRNALSHGFMQTNLQKGARGRTMLHAAAVDQFTTDFAFIGQLADEIDLPRTTLSAKLLHLGVQPVSGPLIDGGLVTIYRRADLGPQLLQALQDLDRYKSNSGRKKCPISCDTLPPDDSCVSAVAARMLEVSLHDLRHLHELGYLKRAVGSKRRFTTNSVLTTKSLLEEMLTLKNCADEVAMSSQTFSRRFVQSGFIEHWRLGSKTLIPKKQLTRVQEHCRLFVSFCEADSILSAPLGHSANLAKTGKLHPVLPNDPGYVSTVRLLHRGDVEKI